jgi:vesicle-fusing ATPase
MGNLSSPNILLIATANDLGAIDEALLRPGRLEVQVEIPLPNESGRHQILNIHTSQMRSNGVIGDDVDLQEIARLTANFSGAEISGLVRRATGFALNRIMEVKMSESPADPALRVKREDFVDALQEIRPAFGVSLDIIQKDIIHHDPTVDVSLYIRRYNCTNPFQGNPEVGQASCGASAHLQVDNLL